MAEIKAQGFPNIQHGSVNFDEQSKSASLVFRVLSDDRTLDGPMNVVNFDSIPKIGTPYQFGNTIRYDLIVKKASPKFVAAVGERGAVWDVEVSYDNSYNGDEAPDPSENDPFTVNVKVERKQYAMQRDFDGNIVRNSAGQPFDTPPMMDFLYPVFSISRTEYRNPTRNIVAFLDRVNSHPFWGFDPEQVWLKEFTVGTSINSYVGNPSWNVTYEIAVNLSGSGWDLDVLDAGVKYLKETSEGSILAVITDTENKLEVTEPQLLNGSGGLLPKNESPVYLHFKNHFTADFNLLKIPNPLLI
ncbi:MAG: hypothetical protein LBQ54_02270 [Planctomycetaceae bacterium]|jgi:hypothetical protein|nr:hypothetical protein [Planctomycetaceae bacterium]